MSPEETDFRKAKDEARGFGIRLILATKTPEQRSASARKGAATKAAQKVAWAAAILATRARKRVRAGRS